MTLLDLRTGELAPTHTRVARDRLLPGTSEEREWTRSCVRVRWAEDAVVGTSVIQSLKFGVCWWD